MKLDLHILHTKQQNNENTEFMEQFRHNNSVMQWLEILSLLSAIVSFRDHEVATGSSTAVRNVFFSH